MNLEIIDKLLLKDLEDIFSDHQVLQKYTIVFLVLNAIISIHLA